MADSIHGHEVLHFMLETDKHHTRASLKQAIDERFGTNVRFHTCSASDMDAEQLIEFLAARGKFVEDSSGKFSTLADKICNHH